jgi:DNA-binding NarL/FixJ family response regulator
MTDQSAVVVSPTPLLRDALVALLMGLPQLTTVRQASQPKFAIETFKEEPASLMLIDACGLTLNLVVDLIREIKGTESQTRCVVLTDGEQDWTKIVPADAIITLGTPAATVRAVVGETLSGNNPADSTIPT